MSIGENIKSKREKKGLSQQQLADAVGCARANIAQYELGSKAPSLAMSKALARFFGCTLDELAGE